MNRSKFTKGQAMQTYESLKHTTWECKYHVVFIPKYRRKTVYAQLRRELGTVFRDLAEQKECKVEEGRNHFASANSVDGDSVGWKTSEIISARLGEFLAHVEQLPFGGPAAVSQCGEQDAQPGRLPDAPQAQHGFAGRLGNRQ